MAERAEINSIVAVDLGSVNTRIVLIDLVDGAYRLVARTVTRTTADDPLRDVAVGLYRGLAQLSQQTGRRLLHGNNDRLLSPERPDGTGVDALLATASVGRPLKVVVVGLMPDVSVTSALNVLTGAYADVVDTLSLADIRTEQQQINAILARKPDLIVIVGGTDAGAEAPILDLVRVVRSAVQIADVAPMVLYAGNRAIQAEVRALLEEFCALFVAENVRPSLLEERLGSAQLELAAVYDQFRVQGRGGFDEVSQLSRAGVLPTSQSYANIVRYLGEIDFGEKRARDEARPGVLALDIGSATTLVAASIGGRTTISIRKDLGIGHSADGLLKATTPGNIRRWLTWDATDEEIADYAHNKTLRPATVPQSDKELELEYALAREAIRIVVDGARANWRIGKKGAFPPLRPIIGAGSVLASAPHSGIAALLMLDALQPEGVTELWLDPTGIIPALGALAYLKPAAVVQMLDAGDLISIGSAVCPTGKVRIGRGGMRVRIKLDNGQEERRRVVAGTIWTFPLPPGQTAEVDIRLSRGLALDGKTRLKLTLRGGTAGLIFDVRGRPLPLLSKAEARAQLYPRWQAGMHGTVRQRVNEVDDSELDMSALGKAEVIAGSESPLPDVILADDEDAPRRRFRLFGRRRRRAAVTAAPEGALGLPGGPPDDSIEAFDAEAQAEEAAAEEAAVEQAERASQRRGLFGRRRAAPEPAAPADGDEGESDAPEESELTGLVDELRASQEAAPKRRFLRR